MDDQGEECLVHDGRDKSVQKGYSRPLLKCVTDTQARYILEELHEGVCRLHLGARSMLIRILRVRYYWSTM